MIERVPEKSKIKSSEKPAAILAQKMRSAVYNILFVEATTNDYQTGNF